MDSVKRVTDPFKCCNRKFHPEDTVVEVGETKIGGGNFAIMAGPCSVESEEQILAVATAVKASGAQILRGGAFKPRTSPYDFQVSNFDIISYMQTHSRKHSTPPLRKGDLQETSTTYNDHKYLMKLQKTLSCYNHNNNNLCSLILKHYERLFTSREN